MLKNAEKFFRETIFYNDTLKKTYSLFYHETTIITVYIIVSWLYLCRANKLQVVISRKHSTSQIICIRCEFFWNKKYRISHISQYCFSSKFNGLIKSPMYWMMLFRWVQRESTASRNKFCRKASTKESPSRALGAFSDA